MLRSWKCLFESRLVHFLGYLIMGVSVWIFSTELLSMLFCMQFWCQRYVFFFAFCVWVCKLNYFVNAGRYFGKVLQYSFILHSNLRYGRSFSEIIFFQKFEKTLCRNIAVTLQKIFHHRYGIPWIAKGNSKRFLSVYPTLQMHTGQRLTNMIWKACQRRNFGTFWKKMR